MTALEALEALHYNATTQLDHIQTLESLTALSEGLDEFQAKDDQKLATVRVLNVRHRALQERIDEQIRDRGFILNTTLHQAVTDFGELVSDYIADEFKHPDDAPGDW